MGRVRRLHGGAVATVALSGLWKERPGWWYYVRCQAKRHIISLMQSVEQKFNRFPGPYRLYQGGGYSKCSDSTQIRDFSLSMELQYSGYSG